MSGSNVKDNKVVLKEDVLIFATGTKIITNVADADVGTTIRDMTINPGDIIITREGNLNLMDENGDITVGATQAYVDAIPRPLLEGTNWTIAVDTITFTSGATTGDSISVSYYDGATRQNESFAVDGLNQVALSATPAAGSYIVIHKV